MTHRAVATKIRFRNSELSLDEKKEAILELLAECNPCNLELGGRFTERIFKAYMQPHRYFHTLDHLLDICQGIRERFWEDKSLASELLLTALFHEHVSHCSNAFVREWFAFSQNLNNLLLALSCRKYGWDVESQLVGDSEIDRKSVV